MRRRQVIKLLGGAAAAWPLPARAQQSIPAIGFLGATALDDYTTPHIDAFRQGLKESDLIEGRDLTILFQWADGHYDRLPGLATELVNRNVSVIFASSLPVRPTDENFVLHWRRLKNRRLCSETVRPVRRRRP
jgi:putative ABC transport system substrate-binding protein